MINTSVSKFLLLALVCAMFSSCYYDVEEELYPGFCNTEDVNYEDVIKPLVQLRCSAPTCHVPGGGGIGLFTSYAGVKAKVDDGTIENEVFTFGAMPPVGSLSSCELDQLRKWIDAGAPEF